MDTRENRLIIAAHHEAGAPRIAQETRQFGIERVVAGIPLDLRIDASKVMEELELSGICFLIPEDVEWPSQLNDLAAPPIGIFVKGNIEALTLQSLAIVGTRNPTPYGIRAAQEFAAGFVDREWAIVSGGAYGIDSAAHKGALIAEGSTVAVTASGLDSLYPAGNQKLFEEILENGAIISEYLPGVVARPHRFLVRNRLIAALSRRWQR